MWGAVWPLWLQMQMSVSERGSFWATRRWFPLPRLVCFGLFLQTNESEAFPFLDAKEAFVFVVLTLSFRLLQPLSLVLFLCRWWWCGWEWFPSAIVSPGPQPASTCSFLPTRDPFNKVALGRCRWKLKLVSSVRRLEDPLFQGKTKREPSQYLLMEGNETKGFAGF